MSQEQDALDDAILSVQPYIADLGLEEKRALHDFALIWTIFESHVSERLGLCESKSVNPKVLCDFAGRADVRCTESIQIKNAIKYWRDRYVDSGGTNANFDDLKFRRNDKKQSVAAILISGHGDIDQRQATLIIVYRLRCNLFHGAKWEYGMQDQRLNFRHGINVMLEVLGADPKTLLV